MIEVLDVKLDTLGGGSWEVLMQGLTEGSFYRSIPLSATQSVPSSENVNRDGVLVHCHSNALQGTEREDTCIHWMHRVHTHLFPFLPQCGPPQLNNSKHVTGNDEPIVANT